MMVAAGHQHGDSDDGDQRYRQAFGGEHDAVRDALIYNGGVRIYLGGKADTIGDGIAVARETLESGAALRQLQRLSGAEWVLSLASIHPSLSGRRLEASTPHKVGSVRTNVYCRTASELARGFAPGFQAINLRGLPVVLPPPYANRPLLRWPTLITALGRLDAHVGGWPILRYLGDHNVVWLRRSGGPPR